jgi:hypothetical protein
MSSPNIQPVPQIEASLWTPLKQSVDACFCDYDLGNCALKELEASQEIYSPTRQERPEIKPQYVAEYPVNGQQSVLSSFLVARKFISGCQCLLHNFKASSRLPLSDSNLWLGAAFFDADPTHRIGTKSKSRGPFSL